MSRTTASSSSSSGSSSPYGTSTILLADHFNDENKGLTIPGFYHGVASGDPLPTAIVLWTRYTPKYANESIDLELRIARVIDDGVGDDDADDASNNKLIDSDSLLDPTKNPDLRSITITGVDNTTDFTAKVDVTGLEPKSSYVYAFLGPNSSSNTTTTATSPVGQTKTAPAYDDTTVEELRYALFSCATYTNGYFHAYDVASTIKDIDFFVHAGDFIYEYGAYSEYASDSPERVAELRPQWETVSLNDYRQRYAVYCEDQALQNMRRRAPMFAIWDDHELADNSYANLEQAGATNHQEVCPVNYTATDDEKNAALCDFDEGNAVTRFQGAAQAYMEWMPIRPSSGSMGQLGTDLGTMTRVLEWGNLATFITMDMRTSVKSKEPTISSVFEEFASVAAEYRNVSEYTDPTSPAKAMVDEVANNVQSKMYNPNFTMIGSEMVNMIQDTFQSSKENGKPWQIFVSPTLMGPNVPLNPNTLWQYASPDKQEDVKSTMDDLLNGAVVGEPLRIITAMAVTMTPWNRDDYNGFAHERSQILTAFQNYANNAVVLGGDLHDSWVWQLYEGGNQTGVKPVAINLGGPAVSSPGFGRTVISLLDLLAPILGDNETLREVIEIAWEALNPGLVNAQLEHAGFVAVKVTPEEHVAEYYHISVPTLSLDYPAARIKGNRLTAEFFCSGKFTTNASVPGSLNMTEPCDAIEFITDRPSEWAIPVLPPIPGDGSTSGSASFLNSFVLSFLVYTFLFAYKHIAV